MEYGWNGKHTKLRSRSEYAMLFYTERERKRAVRGAQKAGPDYSLCLYSAYCAEKVLAGTTYIISLVDGVSACVYCGIIGLCFGQNGL